jgi:hypothetical protein
MTLEVAASEKEGPLKVPAKPKAKQNCDDQPPVELENAKTCGILGAKKALSPSVRKRKRCMTGNESQSSQVNREKRIQDPSPWTSNESGKMWNTNRNSSGMASCNNEADDHGELRDTPALDEKRDDKDSNKQPSLTRFHSEYLSFVEEWETYGLTENGIHDADDADNEDLDQPKNMRSQRGSLQLP